MDKKFKEIKKIIKEDKKNPKVVVSINLDKNIHEDFKRLIREYDPKTTLSSFINQILKVSVQGMEEELKEIKQ